MESLRFIDLFAGVGGTRLAFESQSFDCVFSSEWDLHARATYQANFDDLPHGDITEIPAKHIPPFEVLVAGFPCQPFSTIGKQQGFKHETQGTLFYEIARILSETTPRAFLLENVKGLLTNNNGSTWNTIQEVLSELGYFVKHAVLDSSDFGVPQRRRRLYVVGFRDPQDLESFSFPVPTGDLADFAPHVEWGALGYSISKHLQSTYVFKLSDGRPEIVDQGWTGPIKTLVSSYYKIQRLTGTFVRDGETGLRLLSRSECLAAMGFPSDFILPQSRGRIYRQLGNSVAVPVVAAIAGQMSIALRR
ncbi:DNA (cytosine-5-)-methyltransferase [Aquiluna sp. KACHI24]|uniref:DNA (cytosine-5-)-methyltransferase n=1 Tax=Aquiluna sp. KACHI24 TaxID=2968831 RepID=UPI00220207EF|nr:DNA (cytosine-5-)-methyltransferase [Aquiluna sp. KACHI24]BDQ00947.1 cytosine-specific methyltransferase [Aquiluna sp. KACHI24]